MKVRIAFASLIIAGLWILLRYGSMTAMEKVGIAVLILIFFIIIIVTFLAAAQDKNDKVGLCPQCGQPTLNDFQQCTSAEATVNSKMFVNNDRQTACCCCDKCRQKCLDQWWDHMYDEHRII